MSLEPMPGSTEHKFSGSPWLGYHLSIHLLSTYFGQNLGGERPETFGWQNRVQGRNNGGLVIKIWSFSGDGGTDGLSCFVQLCVHHWELEVMGAIQNVIWSQWRWT